MLKFFPLAILILLSTVSRPAAAGGAENVSSACATLEFMAKMVSLNKMLPADYDDQAELADMESQLAEVNRRICQPVILTVFTRHDTVFDSDTLASTDLYYRSWHFPNGRLFMAAPGADTTIYYPNGQVMAYRWMRGGQALFWPNGNIATERFRQYDATWRYPDGYNIITYESGLQGGRWFYPFPRLDGRIGQEVISSNWGDDGEDFTFLNFTSSGELVTTRERIRRKLVFDDYQLLDVPGVLLLITRLYQNADGAKDFAPADINITGAPF